jgi:hypothetical protein
MARRIFTARFAMTRSGATAQLMSTPRTTLTARTARSVPRPRTRARLLSHPRALHPVHQGRRPGPAHLGRPRQVRPAQAGRPRAVRQGRARRLLPVPRAGRASRAPPRRLAREKTRLRIVTGVPGRYPPTAIHRPTGSGGQRDTRPGTRRTAGPTFTVPLTRSGRRRITIRPIPMGRRMIPTARRIRMARPILTGPRRMAGPMFTVAVTTTVLLATALLATAPLATARLATHLLATAPLATAHPAKVLQIRTGRPSATPQRARRRQAPRLRRMRQELPQRRATPRHLARRAPTPQPRPTPASRHSRPSPGRAPWPEPRRRQRAPRDRRSRRAV